MENLEKLSDCELYKKCQLYGGNARHWMKKFAALLLEVEKRELYKKYKFYSIYEFAAKLAGMRRPIVIEVLRVARKIADKPFLQAQFEEQGWSKIKVVANIATKENEKILAEKVEQMSKATLETFVNELKKQNYDFVKNRPGAAGEQIGLGVPLTRESSSSLQLGLQDVPSAFASQSENSLRLGLDQDVPLVAQSSDSFQPGLDDLRTVQQKILADVLVASANQAIGELRFNFDNDDDFCEIADNAAPPRISVRMPLKPETELRLRQLQKELSKQTKAPMDFNEVMETLLYCYEKSAQTKTRVRTIKSLTVNTRQAELSATAAIIAGVAVRERQIIHQEQECGLGLEVLAKNKAAELEDRLIIGLPPSRHIPSVIKKFLMEKYHGRCAYNGCKKLPEIFHHTRRYSQSRSHDPDSLAPLCKSHERLAHLGLINNEEKPQSFWNMQIFPDMNSPKYAVDLAVNKHRAGRA